MKKLHSAALASVGVILFLAIVSSTASVVTAHGDSHMKTYAYIVNGGSNTVSVIDTDTNKVVATVSVGDTPVGIAVSSEGRKVYVANSGGSNISIIDMATNKVIGSIDNILYPWAIAVNQAGTRLYITRSSALLAIDTKTKKIINTTHIDSAEGVVVSPDGKTVYVGRNSDIKPVLAIDAVTLNVKSQIEAGRYHERLFITPNGKSLYVEVHDKINGTSVYDYHLVDLRTNKVTLGGHLDFWPDNITPSGKRAYLANIYNNTVSVFDTKTNKTEAVVGVGQNPRTYGKFIGTVYVK